MKLKKGDNVIVISGKDKGKTGKIVKSFPALNKVIIAGVNVKKVHERPTRSGQKGQVIDKSLPVNVSSVQFVDPKTNKPSRIGKQFVDGKFVRVSKKSGTII